jgi:hypothetical protein
LIPLPVVSFWYSTWKLQDIYLFPDNPGLSNGLSLSFGILGLCILGLKQFSLTTELQGKHCVVFFCVSRIIVLFWAIFGICHWRGLWNILDNYTGRYSSEILLAACLFFLVLFRSVRNVITTPFVIGFDGDRNQFFNQSMMWWQKLTWPLVRWANKYNFRYSNTAHIPTVKTTRDGLNSFRYYASKTWNELYPVWIEVF